MQFTPTVFNSENDGQSATIGWAVPPEFLDWITKLGGGAILVLLLPIAWWASIAVAFPWAAFVWARRLRIALGASEIVASWTVCGVPYRWRRFSYQCAVSTEFDWDSPWEAVVFREGQRQFVAPTWGDSSSEKLREYLFDAIERMSPQPEWAAFSEWRAPHADSEIGKQESV